MNYRQKKKQEQRAIDEAEKRTKKALSKARSGFTKFTIIDKGIVPNKEVNKLKNREFIPSGNIATAEDIKKNISIGHSEEDAKVVHYQLKKTEIDQKYFIAGDMSILRDEDRATILDTVDQLVKDPTISEARLHLTSGFTMILHNINT